jgi:hypothetical protein
MGVVYFIVTTVTGVTPMIAAKSICDSCDDRDARMCGSRSVLMRALCLPKRDRRWRLPISGRCKIESPRFRELIGSFFVRLRYLVGSLFPRFRAPRRVFVNSMSDLFHQDVSLEYVKHVFDVMARANWHQFQVPPPLFEEERNSPCK